MQAFRLILPVLCFVVRIGIIIWLMIPCGFQKGDFMAQIGDIGIDLGTSNFVMYMKGRGICLREPCVVAMDRGTGNLLAIGKEAQRMIGRTPSNITLIKPFENGEIADFDIAGAMIRHFIGTATGKHLLARPRAIIALPSGIKDLERKALIGVMFDAGVRRTQTVDKCVAAGLGAGLNFDGPFGAMIVDISSAASDIAVLCNSQVAIGTSIRMGGDHFSDSIQRFIRRKYNLLIGENTLEEVKATLGSAVPRESDVSMDVTGRNLISGLPKTQSIVSTDIYEALKDDVSDLIEAIQIVIEKTPPQLASDIFDKGITMTGGGACLYGLSEAIESVLNIPCTVAHDARDCIAMGCARIVEDMGNSKKYLSVG